MATPSTVISLGYGTFGSSSLVITLGYGATGITPPTPPVVTTKTGTGGIDKGAGYRRITKPTGLGYPKKKTKKELRQEVVEPVLEPVVVEQEAPVEFKPIVTMTMAEIDQEIGMLLRRKMLDEENKRRLLILLGSL